MLSTFFLPLHGCITADADSVLQKMLEVGTKAPDFELPDQNGELLKLSEYLGKKVKKKNYGKVSMGMVRTTYFIDKHGIIVKADDKVKAADDPEKMLQELSRRKTKGRNGCMNKKKSNSKKAVMIGCGFVGSASVFALMQSGLFTEIALIDADKNKAEGEAMDISHGIPFASPMRIYVGDYDDVADATIVIISAGAGQKPGETRLDLVNKNVAIFKSIIP